MVDKKTIGISTLITLCILSASMVIPGFFDEPKYYCEERPEVGLMTCDGFSKYVAENGKCLNSEGNKICKEGWVLVTDDTVIDEETEEDIEPDDIGRIYMCMPDGGYCIRKQ